MNTEAQELFHETQRFRQWWILGLIGLVVLLVWYAFLSQVVFGESFGSEPAPNYIIYVIFALFGVGLPWLFHALKLVTVVESDCLKIRLFPLFSKVVTLADIKSFQVREYRPIKEYGGWGIRMSVDHGMAYTVSGNRGVQLELMDGKQLLVGSQQADRLEDALKQAIHRI